MPVYAFGVSTVMVIPGSTDIGGLGDVWEEVLMDSAPDREMAAHVAAALAQLLREDVYLLQIDANERSVSHRLAV